jgi:hypothetical protein
MVDFFVGAKLQNVKQLTTWAQADGVTVILVDAANEPQWRRLLAPVARPQEVGGVYLYRLEPKGSIACAKAGHASASAASAVRSGR